LGQVRGKGVRTLFEAKLNGGGDATGSFTAESNTTLNFSQGMYTLEKASSVAGAGTVLFSDNAFFGGSTYLVEGAFAPVATVISNGTVNFAADVSLPSLTQTGGTLTGTATVTVTGQLNWTNGTMTGGGTTVAAGGLTVDTTSFGNPNLSGRTLDNVQSASFLGSATFSVSNGGTLDNQAGATFTIQGNGLMAPGFFQSPGNVRNERSFVMAGGGTANLSVNFTNTGIVDVQSGTLDLSGNFSNFYASSQALKGGTYVVTGTLQFNSASIATNQANIVLDGPAAQIIDQFGSNALANFADNAAGASFTVQNGQSFVTNASFTNEGTLVVNPSSTFTTIGNYTQLATGLLQIGMAGTNQYGRVIANGVATLDRTLRVVLLNGFQPQNGDQFQVLTYSAENGVFATYQFPTLSGGLSFHPVYNSTNLTLSVSP
jgi:hypothetical protein